MQQHLSGHADTLPSSVSPGLAGIVAKCLRRNPDERYQNDADLLADLDRYPALTAADFQFVDEREARVPNADKRMLLLAGGMTVGFIALLAIVIGVIVVAQHV
jgi:hypothetical protein